MVPVALVARSKAVLDRCMLRPVWCWQRAAMLQSSQLLLSSEHTQAFLTRVPCSPVGAFGVTALGSQVSKQAPSPQRLRSGAKSHRGAGHRSMSPSSLSDSAPRISSRHQDCIRNGACNRYPSELGKRGTQGSTQREPRLDSAHHSDLYVALLWCVLPRDFCCACQFSFQGSAEKCLAKASTWTRSRKR